MRDTTDRPEGVRAGCAVLAGTDPSRVSFHINRLLDDPQVRSRASQNPYGDGRAAERIADRIALELVGDDSSVTSAFLLIVVLVGTDILLSLVKRWSPRLDRLLEGQPLVILRNGVPLRRRMRLERVDEEDILSAARETRGLDRMEQIKRAVLERNGAISIVPRREP